MVLTQYAANRTVRLMVRGPERQLEPLGQILERLFPGDVLVSSDEDEAAGALDSDQLEVLNDLADYYAELACCQPAPAR